MKINKGILQISKDTNTDPHTAMMIYRTALLGPNQPSPKEKVHGHKAYSDLPMTM